jgi:hypothetical protein
LAVLSVRPFPLGSRRGALASSIYYNTMHQSQSQFIHKRLSNCPPTPLVP